MIILTPLVILWYCDYLNSPGLFRQHLNTFQMLNYLAINELKKVAINMFTKVTINMFTKVTINMFTKVTAWWFGCLSARTLPISSVKVIIEIKLREMSYLVGIPKDILRRCIPKFHCPTPERSTSARLPS